jgi:hypothetical protein
MWPSTSINLRITPQINLISMIPRTKAALEGLSEDDLRQEVLIPLLRQMRFRDVRHHHGSIELGKDIVMWAPDALGIREDYAVVAKRGKISGRSSGSNSAAEVASQVRKALGSTYQDPVTGQPRRPTRCWVVASGKIGPEAHSALEAELSEYRGALRFIDGDKLWEEVEKHLLSGSVIETLSRVQEILETASENYRVLARPEKGGTWFTVQPKHPAAQDIEPIEMKAVLAFPETAEGQEEFKKFQHHMATGAPVSIDGRYLQGFSLPEFLQRLIDPARLGPDAVVLPPIVPQHPIATRLIIEPETGDPRSLDQVVFDVLQQGTEEITMQSQHHGAPWHFGIVLNFRERLLHFTYRSNYAGANAEAAVRTARFERAMSKGGLLRIEHAHSGLLLASAQIPAGLTSHMNEKVLFILERLAFIQEKTGLFLDIREECTPQDAKQILQVAEIIERGFVSFAPQPGTVRQGREEASRLLEQTTNEPDKPFILLPSQEENAMVLGTVVPMGPSALIISGFKPVPESAARLKTLLADPAQTGPFELEFVATEEATLTGIYQRWLPEGEVKPEIFGHRVAESAQ